jgi:hypothetical protein
MIVPTSIVFAVGAAVFLLLAVVRLVRDRRLGPASRTWFLVGGIFAFVAVWLSVNR